MKVIPYDSKYKDKFIEYNTDWIVDNFGFLEKEDKETFENIDIYKIHKKITAFAVIFLCQLNFN